MLPKSRKQSTLFVTNEAEGVVWLLLRARKRSFIGRACAVPIPQPKLLQITNILANKHKYFIRQQMALFV